MESSSPFSPTALIMAIVIGFPILFVGFWCFVVFLISRIGGWNRLSQRYSAGSRLPSGGAKARVSGLVGIASYRGVLTLHQDSDGIFLEVMPLFKMGHPGLFIPWTEITARSQQTILWSKTEKLTIGSPKVATLTFPQNVIKSG